MRYQNIPTNLIVGFLGSGKTTAIRHLLSQAPDGERWGVLVNEFGEVGIDGALLDADGIAVREVAGGCLCCVASGGLQVGLNRLIRELDPDRILIEPSGLGHPAQILAKLSSAPFDQVLDLRATIGLVDARQLSQSKYTDHPTYQDQIQLADVLVASKADLYHAAELEVFESFAQALAAPKAHVATVEHGRLRSDWLDIPSTRRQALHPDAHQHNAPTETHSHDHHAHHASQPGWLMIEHSDTEHVSCGWILDAHRVFPASQLKALLLSIEAVRIKGVLHTDEGWVAMNMTREQQAMHPVDPRADSRLEIIHEHPLDWHSIDERLMELQATT